MWQEWTSADGRMLHHCRTSELVKENGVTEEKLGRHVQEYSSRTMVKKGQNSLRMAYTHITHVKAISLGIDHLVIKQSRSPWSHQEAVSLMELIRLIYLLIYSYLLTYL